MFHRLSGGHQPHRRQAQALLEELRGVAAITAGRLAANVGVMRDGDHVPDDPAVAKHRLRRVDVRQMGAAGIRVVERVHVAGPQFVAEARQERPHGVRDRAEMQRQREPLGDQPSRRIAQRGRQVHRVLQVRRPRRAHQRHRHLIHQRRHRVTEQFALHRVDGPASGAHRLASSSSAPSGSREQRQPGGTTVVAS